jgi:hypothetical protein
VQNSIFKVFKQVFLFAFLESLLLLTEPINDLFFLCVYLLELLLTSKKVLFPGIPNRLDEIELLEIILNNLEC